MTDCIKFTNPTAAKQTGGKYMPPPPRNPSANLSSVYYENYCCPPTFLLK